MRNKNQNTTNRIVSFITTIFNRDKVANTNIAVNTKIFNYITKIEYLWHDILNK